MDLSLPVSMATSPTWQHRGLSGQTRVMVKEEGCCARCVRRGERERGLEEGKEGEGRGRERKKEVDDSECI